MLRCGQMRLQQYCVCFMYKRCVGCFFCKSQIRVIVGNTINFRLKFVRLDIRSECRRFVGMIGVVCVSNFGARIQCSSERILGDI